MSISPICDFCKQELTDFGGLVFSPPDNNEAGNSQVEKLHVCKTCYQGMRSMFTKDEATEQVQNFAVGDKPVEKGEDRKQIEDLIRTIKPGVYKHSKSGNLYRLFGVGKHTETMEDMAVYKPVGSSETKPEILIRPAKMFVEKVLINGSYLPRFVFVSDTL